MTSDVYAHSEHQLSLMEIGDFLQNQEGPLQVDLIPFHWWEWDQGLLEWCPSQACPGGYVWLSDEPCQWLRKSSCRALSLCVFEWGRVDGGERKTGREGVGREGVGREDRRKEGGRESGVGWNEKNKITLSFFPLALVFPGFISPHIPLSLSW